MAMQNASSPGVPAPQTPSASCPSRVADIAVADGGIRLLKALWRSPEKVHQIGGLNRKSKWFSNTPVKDGVDALARAQSMSNSGIDPYFAPAEYRTPNSRTAENVPGAYAFWFDLDVGADKAEGGKGYATIADAQAAIRKFRIDAGLPKPTHAVESGSGLHVYCVLDDFLDRESWLAHAGKLKAIAKKFGFFADPTRTADIASVMRLPGTLNHKYDPPRAVKLVFESDKFIAKAVMLQAINVAFDKLKNEPITAVQTAVSVEVHAPVSSMQDIASYGPPDLERLASALSSLDPDCDDLTWKMYRLAPLARIATEHPQLAAQVYALAKRWSSGELGVKPSKKWVTRSASDGLTGAVAFEVQWKRFLQPNHSATKTSIGTIYHDAKAAGWIPDATSKATDTFAALAAIQAQFGLIKVSGRISVFDLVSLSAHTEQGAAQRLVLYSRTDGRLLIRRALKEQFPDVDDAVILNEFWVSPQTICYAGVDFHPTGTAANYLNLWVGPTVVSKVGCWALIKTFLLEVLCAGNEGYYVYLISFIAHALQHPEQKPGVMIILLGGQGIGKGTLARILQKIWTATFLQTSDMSVITGAFNAALERSYIVFMDEALFAGDRRASDALKSLVTEPTILINEKHQPGRQVNSFHRFFAATNAGHLKSTDRDDRRDFTLRVSESRKGDTAYWQALYREIETGGVEAMAHDLLGMDLAGFNVRSKPDTNELLEQKLQSLDPIPRWWHQCLCDGEFNDGESWPDFVATLDAITGICELNGGRMYRKPSPQDVVKVMMRLCPSATAGQQDTNLGRKRGLKLPPLEQARADFNQYIGGMCKW